MRRLSVRSRDRGALPRRLERAGRLLARGGGGLERRPDFELCFRPRDHFVGELARAEVSAEVGEAIAANRALVALESSLIAQGLPAPHNLETALASEAAVREEGAVPATTAIDQGRLLLGAPRAVLERLADSSATPAKGASRDLGPLLAVSECVAAIRAQPHGGGRPRPVGAVLDPALDVHALGRQYPAIVRTNTINRRGNTRD